MLKSAFTFLAELFWLIVRWKKKQDDPQSQYEKAKSENAKAVTSGDAAAVNAALDRSVDGLPDDARSGDKR